MTRSPERGFFYSISSKKDPVKAGGSQCETDFAPRSCFIHNLSTPSCRLRFVMELFANPPERG